MKIRQLIIGFLPWIVLIPFPSDKMGWGAGLGFVVAVVQLVLNLRRGTPANSMILDFSTIGFLAVLSVIGFAAPHSALIQWNDVLSFGWLALTAAGSMAVRWPFTMGMARREVAREIWDSPDFLRTHMAITRIWALSFTGLALALGVVRAAELGIAIGLPVRLAGLLIPFALTLRKIKDIRARTAAA